MNSFNPCRAVLLLLLPLMLLGCGEDTSVPKIRIGSKNFTEQFILAEIMAQVIESQTAVQVERVFNLGGTMICHNALVEGEIDLYAEYTGTGLTAILHQEVMTDPDTVFTAVRDQYREVYRLKWLQPFGFNNTYALTVREGDAQTNGWQNISDLASADSLLTAGFTSEFIERPDGYPGMKATYGISFESIKDMDPTLMYQAIADKQVDAICAFSTDGRIKAYTLRPLKDDRLYFPPYSAAPVIRLDFIRKYPEVEKALAQLAGIINDKAMQQLNYNVDELKQSPEAVAKDFLIEQGLGGNL